MTKKTSLDKKIGDKLKELPRLYERAQGTIKIATDFDSRFFDDKRVKSGISKAMENGAKVMFLSESKNIPSWYTGQKEIEIKHTKKLENHLMIIDDRHVRLEHTHEPLKFGDKAEDVAFIFKDFPKLAERCSQRFDVLWKKAS